MKEITYTPGRLAKKIGVSRNTVKNHLSNSGLISQCYRSPNGYLQIPYRVAALMSSVEALALREPQEPRHQPKPKTVAREESVALNDSALSSTDKTPMTTSHSSAQKRPKTRVEILTQPRDDKNLAEHYGQIGKVLRQAGITVADFVRDYYQNKGVEQQKDDTTTAGQTTGELSRDDDLQS